MAVTQVSDTQEQLDQKNQIAAIFGNIGGMSLPQGTTTQLAKMSSSNIGDDSMIDPLLGTNGITVAGNNTGNATIDLTKSLLQQGIDPNTVLGETNTSSSGTDLNTLLNYLKSLSGTGTGTGTGTGAVNSLLSGGAGNTSTTSSTNPLTGAGSLASNATKFSDVYKAPDNTAENDAFTAYLNSINAPSSTEQVQQDLENQDLTNTLAQIDRLTGSNVADVKMNANDRGIGGPGQTSDIEMNAIAQAVSGGEQTKAGAYTTLANARLARQTDKEKAAQAALGQKYQQTATEAGQDKTIAAQGAQTDVQAANELLGTQYTAEQTAAENAKNRILQGTTTYAQLSSSDQQNLLNNFVKTAISGQELSQADKEFYDKLDADTQNQIQNRILQQEGIDITKTNSNNANDPLNTLLGGVAKGIGNEAGVNIADTLF